MIEKFRSSWQREPIDHPIILAGSTGSRGSTLMLMDTISRLPQGALGSVDIYRAAMIPATR